MPVRGITLVSPARCLAHPSPLVREQTLYDNNKPETWQTSCLAGRHQLGRQQELVAPDEGDATLVAPDAGDATTGTRRPRQRRDATLVAPDKGDAKKRPCW